MASTCQVGLDPAFEYEHAELLEARNRDVENRLVGEIGERLATPEGEGTRQGVGRLVVPFVFEVMPSLARE